MPPGQNGKKRNNRRPFLLKSQKKSDYNGCGFVTL